MTRAISSVLAIAAFAVANPLAAQSLENPDSAFKDMTSGKAWHATVERTERGFLIGNPDAETRLVIFTSYGCKGCHEFSFRGYPELDLALLAPGLLSLEIRTRLDHPVDLPLALLAACGEPSKFKVNHAMFVRDHKRWRERWDNASAFNRSHWKGSGDAARTSLVSALDFENMMARRRGYSRMDLNRCLNDRKAIDRLKANAAADEQEFDLTALPNGDPGPHFVLDGEVLAGVHDWDALYPILRDHFRPKREAR
jgi:hypothetical protein